jgi:holo-[acyl-carrier protein] synthase
MIVGIGTDVIEISRIAALLKSPSGKRFLQRILTPEERATAEHKKTRLAEFAAGRFAAKEAVAKAAGCGIGGKVGFQDISVINDKTGKPLCQLSAAALRRCGFGESIRIHLSISHSESLALAFAVIESG